MNSAIKAVVTAVAILPVMLSCGGSSGRTPVTHETVAGVEMVSLPGGSFQMGNDYTPGGDSAANVYRPDEQPVHTVTLSPFMISVCEVTQEQYESVMGANPSSAKGARFPVTNLGANDAIDFCNRLSEQAGLEPCYDAARVCDFAKNGFRLPTEAEWEYACRAGTGSLFSSGNTAADLARVGWYEGNSGGTLHDVGTLEPNQWGLYDMHGNVFEMCYDGWEDSDDNGIYDRANQTDPVNDSDFNYRIIRGGGWFSAPSECRSATRGMFWTGGGSGYLGFRLARSVR